MLLVAMAFDLCAAVCHPHQYMTIVHPHLCFSLAIASWAGGLMNSLIQTGLMMAMHHCGNHPNHFCEMPAFLKLACEDTEELMPNVGGPSHSCCCSSSTNSRHLCIHFPARLNINSVAGCRKAFGKCGFTPWWFLYFMAHCVYVLTTQGYLF